MTRFAGSRVGIRALGLLAAVLQLALPGAAAWADAQLDAAGTHARPHLESHSTTTCVCVHPADCALCRFLTAPLGAARPLAVRPCVPDQPGRALVTQVADPRSPGARLPPSRAPPALS